MSSLSRSYPRTRPGPHRASPTGRTRSQRGFTLLEVMVATAILCAGLAAIVNALGMAVQSTAIANGYEKARLVAENQLAVFLTQDLIADRQARGRENGLEWRIRAQSDPALPELYHITVEVDFRAGAAERTFRLTTSQTAFDLAPAELPEFPEFEDPEGAEEETEDKGEEQNAGEKPTESAEATADQPQAAEDTQTEDEG